MDKVIIIYVVTLVANVIDVLTYSVFIVGVRTKKLAISNALFQALMIVSRGALYVQAPLLGSLADDAVLTGGTDDLEMIFRNVIFAVTIGSLIGGLITPFFIDFFSAATNYFERLGTIPKMISNLIMDFRSLSKKKVKIEGYKSFNKIIVKDIPFGLVALNSISIAVYSVGLLSAVYAGALAPEYRMTASQLSAAIVGIAAALMMIFIDPMIAVVTDQTLDGKLSPDYIKSLVFFLVMGDFVGTLISQILFLPLSSLIIWVARGI